MAMPKGSKKIKSEVVEEMKMEDSSYTNTVVNNGREKSMADKMMPVMMVLLLVMAFGLGTLWNRLQNAGGAAGTGKYKTFDEAVKGMAKAAKVKDIKKFEACVKSGEKEKIVNADLAEGQTVGVQGTPGIFINGRMIPGAVPFDQFKDIIDQELGAKPMVADVVRKTLSLGSAPYKGDLNAPIKIFEYSDFQCPYCEAVYPTLNQVMKEYQGKVLLAYKHWPLRDRHPRAQKAAEASECARDQGKFWEYHDQLYGSYKDWAQL